MLRLVLPLLLVCACAEGSSVPEGGAPEGGAAAAGAAGGGGGVPLGGRGGEGQGAGPIGGESSGGAGGMPPMAQSCPPGEFATALTEGGFLVCDTLGAATLAAANTACSVTLGARDGCSGCTTPPAKWGATSQTTCNVGMGANNTCTTPTLGTGTVSLFGLNTDGDVDDNDKLYAGFACAPGDTSAGSCEAGELMVGMEAGTAQCVSAESAVASAVNGSCSLFLGWRDGCDGCTSAPAKWGKVSAAACATGGGAGDTCTVATLGTTTVQLFGLQLGGDVDGNDKLYMGLTCPSPAPESGTATGACPAGQLVTGIQADGTLECASPAPAIVDQVAAQCTLYLGWADGCNACVTAPAKWGRVRGSFCTNDLGADNTCTTAVLGSDTLSLFGLSFDGDVNDDDKLYVGLKCE